ncbi:unnamed protein product, partial [Musa textilis]
VSIKIFNHASVMRKTLMLGSKSKNNRFVFTMCTFDVIRKERRKDLNTFLRSNACAN